MRNNWILFAATDINDSDPHPHYRSNITFQYFFAIEQFVKIEVYKSSLEEKNNLFASAEFNIVDLIRSPTKSIELKLADEKEIKENQPTPVLKLTIDEAVEAKDILTIVFSANFTKKSIFSTPKTYYTLWKSIEGSPFTKVL